MELHREIRNWIQSVIRQRAYLVKEGLSKQNPYEMATNIDFLQKRLDYFPYDSNKKISMLFQQNKGKILSILTDKRIEQYTKYDQLTKTILNEEDISDRKFPGNGKGIQSGLRSNGQMGITA